MFVFWYCHKRGKEVRLAREGAAPSSDGAADQKAEEGEDDDDDIEVTDSEDGEDGGAAEELAEKIASDVKGATEAGTAEAEGDGKAKEDLLAQAEPSEVPLPDAEKGEKGAKLEEVKSVGA